jgi:hypothetical protein
LSANPAVPLSMKSQETFIGLRIATTAGPIAVVRD